LSLFDSRLGSEYREWSMFRRFKVEEHACIRLLQSEEESSD
jgi:hypothetical protein